MLQNVELVTYVENYSSIENTSDKLGDHGSDTVLGLRVVEANISTCSQALFEAEPTWNTGKKIYSLRTAVTVLLFTNMK